MDEWNLPENCKLRMEAVQTNHPNEPQPQYRLRLAEDHKATVSESAITIPNLKVYILNVL